VYSNGAHILRKQEQKYNSGYIKRLVKRGSQIVNSLIINIGLIYKLSLLYQAFVKLKIKQNEF
jgi:molybdate-binding protein